ncbi:LacI family DNA-binding transcriptional regulator [Subtercola frigoramans]|uniref:DNA-binding LacI/PurR family transcriptional regulator n=1 Tax=Subtercola frigoramans TaxID=120298 RepID=A0ABS2L339_9MICO|nr:LacI family DNA-binding transcriptional regulator [Subtercola frigoramans]MBM7470896.1 DNA-binding LacI/PurR family transcriptional regulator [Subtercola frigoramans]
MKRLATISDVAEAAGVSKQTVSNVLNTPAIVRPDTRERVQRAIDTLEYRPHASARRLRTRRSSTLGIRLDPMVDGISGSVLDRFLHALTEQAAAYGLRILLFTAADPDDEIAQYRRLLDGADVDAFVLTSTFHGDPRTEWLIANGHDFVTFGRPWGIDDMDDPQHLWVDVDGCSGVREATAYALATAGPRVGYIGWPSPSGTGDDRRRGWLEAMAGSDTPLSNVELDALQIAVDDGVASGRAAMADLVAANPSLDAVVCASDSLALGAMMASNRGIPVTGYDNTPVAAAVGLSSVEQPLVEVAARVLELLVGEFGAPTPGPGTDLPPAESRHRLLTPRLVVRQSLDSAGGRLAPDTTQTQAAGGR